MKPCPHCAETIRDTAKVCPHCGRGMNRGALQRGAALVALAILTVIGGTCAFMVDRVEQGFAKAREAEYRRVVGPPPPPADVAARQRRQQIYRAAQSRGVAEAAKAYGVTRDEVRGIVAEGQRQGWR